MNTIGNCLVVDTETGALKAKDVEPSDETLRMVHKTIKKVSEDTEGMRFNTAISAMMELVNHLTKQKELPRMAVEALVRLLSPYAPHISEELHSRLGGEGSASKLGWPEWDEDLCKAQTVTLAVQVNGKVRAKIKVAPDIAKDDALAMAKAESNVQTHLEGKTIKREIYVPGRIVNLVVG